MNSNDKPLVSFVLLAYKQEQFIREAIEGAFAQTYSPLEIILSDDCSPDRTFAIMQEMASGYHGPHRVKVRQTKNNSGLSAHLDEVVADAQGEWLVIAAGDDISLPERVSRHIALVEGNAKIYSTFLAPLPFGGTVEGRVPKVCNRVIHFPESIHCYGGGVLGATHAVRKTVWMQFGPLGSGIIAEDWVIPFRSSLLGAVVWSEEPGVRYRVHDNSVTAHFWGNPGKSLPSSRQLGMELNALTAFRRDLQTALRTGLVSKIEGEEGLEYLDRALKTNQIILNNINAKSLGAWFLKSIRILLYPKFIGSYGRRTNIIRRTFPPISKAKNQ